MLRMNGRSMLFLAVCIVVVEASVEAATCPPLTSSTVTIKCFSKNGKTMAMVDCKKPMKVKTKAVFQCPDNFKINENYQKVMCLPNGQWDNAVVTCAAAGEGTAEVEVQIDRPQGNAATIPQTSVQLNDDGAFQNIGELGSFRVSKTPGLLIQAMADCDAFNASLIVVDSPQKIDILNALFAKSAAFAGASNDQEVWVGVMRESPGVWSVTSDEEVPTNVNEIASFKWADGCPKPGDKNRCTVFQKKTQAHCDIACENPQKQPYICTAPATPSR